MDKKTISIAAAIILIIGLGWYYNSVHGWLVFRKKSDTPKEFQSQTVIKKEDYIQDCIQLSHQFRVLLAKHVGFFQNNAYFDSTEIIIDSILYSPDYRKLAILILIKNPSYRQLVPGKTKGWYYDATAYLGVRQNDTIALSWIGPVFTNSNNEGDISNSIREACFRTFATKEESGSYKYNLNDKRFWDGPIWKMIRDDQLRKEEFEREKEEHPENVSEPGK